MSAVGSRVYLGTAANSNAEFYVLDATNPAAIRLLGTYKVGADVNDIDATGDYAYLATANVIKEFLVLNVANPNAPIQQAAFSVPSKAAGRGVAYRAGRVVGVTYDAGSQPDFFVLSAPYGGSLQLLASLDLGTDNTDVALYGGRAFVSTRLAAKGLRVVDVSSPAGPVLTGTFSTGDKANGVAVRDSLPYLATSHNTLELQVAHGGVRVEPILIDVNGDGLVTTACLGDENTQQAASPLRSWCEAVDDLVTRPSWRTRNRAAPLATVYAGGTPAPQPDGPTQLATALTLDAPDAAVLAFGTYDIALMMDAGRASGPPPLEAIVSAYQSMMTSAAASKVTTFVALTPPRGSAAPSQTNEFVARLNNRLRHEFPAERLIDFFAPMDPAQDFLPLDPLHMNQSGQSKRAAAARHELDN